MRSAQQCESQSAGMVALRCQTSVGTVLVDQNRDAARHIRVFHSLKGTANAQPTFGLSYFNDLALVLRWLYTDESDDARRCTDYELVDCLCRCVLEIATCEPQQRSRSSIVILAHTQMGVWGIVHRDVALAILFGRNTVVNESFLPAVRVMLRTLRPAPRVLLHVAPGGGGVASLT